MTYWRWFKIEWKRREPEKKPGRPPLEVKEEREEAKREVARETKGEIERLTEEKEAVERELEMPRRRLEP